MTKLFELLKQETQYQALAVALYYEGFSPVVATIATIWTVLVWPIAMVLRVVGYMISKERTIARIEKRVETIRTMFEFYKMTK